MQQGSYTPLLDDTVKRCVKSLPWWQDPPEQPLVELADDADSTAAAAGAAGAVAAATGQGGAELDAEAQQEALGEKRRQRQRRRRALAFSGSSLLAELHNGGWM